MQDILKRIIEMDEEARRIKAKAEAEKAEAQADIANAKQKIHSEYIERARIRALKNSDTEQKAADEEWKNVQKKHELARQALEKEFAENHDTWVNNIVANVLRQI